MDLVGMDMSSQESCAIVHKMALIPTNGVRRSESGN